MEFQDLSVQCVDCRQDFTFTAGEQEFYDRKGFRERPKRCKTCRESRKLKRESGGDQGGSDAAGNSRSYSTGGGGARGGGRPQRELYDGTCAACGATARVPFQPIEGRPVYCRDCYANRPTGSNY